MTLSRISSVCLAVIATTAMIMALRLGLTAAGTPGPGLFPFISALILFAGSIATGIAASSETGPAQPIDIKRFLRYAAAIAGFGLVIKPIGIAVATAGFFLAVLRGIEHKSWAYSAIVAVTVAFFSWGLFKHLLGVPLPQGVLGVG